MKKFIGAWWPAAAFMALLFLLSAQSALPEPHGPWILSWDKAHHFGAYCILGLLLRRGARLRPIVPGSAGLHALAIGALFGASDELHQRFVPGRDMNVLDWVADVTGIAMGVFIGGVVEYYKTHGGCSNGAVRKREDL